jgi:hypothetical protein
MGGCLPMKRVVSLAILLIPLLLVISFVTYVVAQDALTNTSIISLWQANSSEGLVVRMIEQNPGNYSLTANDLKQLLDNHVSDRVIQAMFDKMRAQKQAAEEDDDEAAENAAKKQAAAGGKNKKKGGPPAKPAPPTGTPGVPSVFFFRGNQWVEVITEPITWTRNGVTNNIKKYASMGISRPPMRGELSGEHSYTVVPYPPDVVLNMPDSAIVQDYRIVPLQVEKGKRLVVVGGTTKADALHQSVPFTVERLSGTQYRVQFPNTFGAGEYGAFNINSTGTKEQEVGKIYTFRILPQ